MSDPATYSISVRLRRTSTEYSYVRVPVTDEVIKRADDGTGRLDPVKVMAKACELGESAGVQWYAESRNIEPHPTQQTPTADEKSY